MQAPPVVVNGAAVAPETIGLATSRTGIISRCTVSRISTGVAIE